MTNRSEKAFLQHNRMKGAVDPQDAVWTSEGFWVWSDGYESACMDLHRTAELPSGTAGETATADGPAGLEEQLRYEKAKTADLRAKVEDLQKELDAQIEWKEDAVRGRDNALRSERMLSDSYIHIRELVQAMNYGGESGTVPNFAGWTDEGRRIFYRWVEEKVRSVVDERDRLLAAATTLRVEAAQRAFCTRPDVCTCDCGIATRAAKSEAHS